MISVSGVSKQFGETPVFDRISFEVRERESVVLIGPSGGGKSVLLKIIAGLLPPDTGQVEVRTKNIGMLFQKNALFDSLTVIENLLFPLREKKGIEGPAAIERAKTFWPPWGSKETKTCFRMKFPVECRSDSESPGR